MDDEQLELRKLVSPVPQFGVDKNEKTSGFCVIFHQSVAFVAIRRLNEKWKIHYIVKTAI